MIADVPPKLWTPAIIRAGEPWQREAHKKLEALGIPFGVRLAVVSELLRLQGERPSVIRPALCDLQKYAGIGSASILPGIGGFIPSSATAITASYIASYAGTSASFSSCNIGTAAANRYVIVFTGVGFGTPTQGTPTINGVNATIVATGSGGQSKVSIFIALVASGTSVTINTAWSSASSCGIDIWVSYSLSATTTFATGNSGAQPGSISITPAGNGFLVAGRSTGGGAGVGMSWTNATKVSDVAPDGSNSHSAAWIPNTTNSAVTITASNGADSNRAMCAACWGV